MTTKPQETKPLKPASRRCRRLRAIVLLVIGRHRKTHGGLLGENPRLVVVVVVPSDAQRKALHWPAKPVTQYIHVIGLAGM